MPFVDSLRCHEQGAERPSSVLARVAVHHDNPPIGQHDLGVLEHFIQNVAPPALVDVNPLVEHAVNPPVTWLSNIENIPKHLDSQTPQPNLCHPKIKL